ncbi:MFS transporter [Blastochloris sulfoviridis]|uniref:MFS transporter n=1 Tax=Blastochloris sulfoviridis TaxID=50712 RepID=A0A5M6I5S7_9HYPH|nr:MFS transporter [Blastochloris sulfoviridis]KAA5603129.1 MFS transporter [Blastochloris sulfoviridis]
MTATPAPAVRPATVSASLPGWRTPGVIVLAGCLIAMISFGPRSAMGFFTNEMSVDRGWALAVFSLSAAIQNILWGIGQPFAGALADRFGVTRVLVVGAVLYAAGLIWMANAADPFSLHMSAGVLIGFGLAGCSFNLVLAAFGKLLPLSWRPMALGAGSAAGSFGQFLFAPLTVFLKGAIGWEATLMLFGAAMLIVLPLSVVLMTPRAEAPADAPSAAETQTLKAALAEALGHRSYNLLVAGFFVCGFHLAFITIHLPKYLVDHGISNAVGGWVMALIGLFNLAGSLLAGYWSGKVSKPYLLSAIYLARAVLIVGFVLLPLTPLTALAFGAGIGLLWLSTVPPTSGLVLVMFGPRWMAMLFGVVFLSHQVGSFLGVWLAGLLYDSTGSYDVVWWLGVALGLFAALVHLPIQEQPVARATPAST